ncbi:T9SS type A sorting domain-containing protein [Polaribacter litorisediminis]|uniref:T9SS type A sorting domain-containing protein n=1 Tax=Polaribacter litorisediminis TaxID=1908341 RepID=UPI001CBFC817|nr:T9SS type A sorting domain-containing protein [Polaribacter litorisediminis]UAM98729.1 T9SS type A sorting domain-containing protein [Polaribacter litorisediminis]
MKTKLLFIALFISTFLSAQSIEFTSAELTTAEIGSTITINYKYTIANDGNIYCAINLYNDWTWAANVVDGSLSPAPAGTDMTGSFSFSIPEGTTPAADLTSPFNYKMAIELSDSAWTWLAGAYPAAEINIVPQGALSVDSFTEMLDKISVYPNPSSNMLHIKGMQNLESSRIRITNLLGKELYTSNLNNSKIDISNFNAGIYILTIQSEKKSKSIKFVKQ